MAWLCEPGRRAFALIHIKRQLDWSLPEGVGPRPIYSGCPTAKRANSQTFGGAHTESNLGADDLIAPFRGCDGGDMHGNYLPGDLRCLLTTGVRSIQAYPSRA